MKVWIRRMKLWIRRRPRELGFSRLAQKTGTIPTTSRLSVWTTLLVSVSCLQLSVQNVVLTGAISGRVTDATLGEGRMQRAREWTFKPAGWNLICAIRPRLLLAILFFYASRPFHLRKSIEQD